MQQVGGEVEDDLDQLVEARSLTGQAGSATSDKGSCRSSGKNGVIDSSPSTSTRPPRAESDACLW
jgi:hypothetical protein